MTTIAQTTTTYSSGERRFLASQHGLQDTKNATLLMSDFTEGTHFPNGYLLAGQTVTEVPGTDDPDLSFLPNTGVVGIIDVSGLSEFPGGSGALDTDTHAFTSFQYSDDATWIRGRHTVRFGADRGERQSRKP